MRFFTGFVGKIPLFKERVKVGVANAIEEPSFTVDSKHL